MKIDELINKQEMERLNVENQKKMLLRNKQKQAVSNFDKIYYY
jgi:hypothetical protein